jgi:hypothetical protein
VELRRRRPGNVTFAVKSNDHEAHGFSINGKQTKLLRRGKTAKLAVSSKRRADTATSARCPDTQQWGCRAVFTVG